jgi:hypothetical protein
MARNIEKYAEIGRRLRNIPLEGHISSHEWEELVHKLCASNDAGLHDIGIKELLELKRKRAIEVEK